MKKQKSGLYRARVKIGVGPDGKDIYKYVSGRTKAELQAAREAAVAYYITGDALEEDRLFGDYATEWFEIRKKPFVSASSRESYRSALNKNILPVFGDRNLRAVSAMELQSFVNGFQGMSATKITVLIATLRGIYRSALSDRLVRVDPTVSLVRPKAAAPREKAALTPEQRAAIVDLCPAHPMGHYLALLYYLGVRPGEARGLQWGDIDWSLGRVRVCRDIDYKDHARAGSLKTRASERTLPLPAPLREILRPLRGLPGCYIASGQTPELPLAKTSGERLWVELMRACGMARPLTDEERARNKFPDWDVRSAWAPLITPHALRHNFATICWEHGLEPFTTMKLMGHSSIKTTMDIYTHLSEAQLQATANQVDDMFASPAPAPKNRATFLQRAAVNDNSQTP